MQCDRRRSVRRSGGCCWRWPVRHRAASPGQQAGGRCTRQRQRPPRPGPSVRHARCRPQHLRHEQRRQQDAETSAAVVDAEQQPTARRPRLTKPRCKQPARHEHPCAGHPGQQALKQQGRRVGHETAARHEHARQHSPDHQQPRRAEAPHQHRRDQRTDQVADRIRRVHAAGQRIAPAKVRAHGRQQQCVCEAGDTERNRRAHRQRKCKTQRGLRRGGRRSERCRHGSGRLAILRQAPPPCPRPPGQPASGIGSACSRCRSSSTATCTASRCAPSSI